MVLIECASCSLHFGGVNSMCKLLEPMYSALHLVDTEVNPTMGLFYHVFDSMKKKLYPTVLP